jgi:short-subunit dehydrogenase
MELTEKQALITGATSGIGSATARSLATRGASVILTGRDQTLGDQVVAEIRQSGGDARFITADLTEVKEVSRLAAAVGVVDIPVNVAGFYAVSATKDMDSETFDPTSRSTSKRRSFSSARWPRRWPAEAAV